MEKVNKLLNKIKQQQMKINESDREMEKYKNFEIKLKTKKIRTYPKTTETTTYCVNCNYTCDKKCHVTNKRNCCCIENDYCTECPGKCHVDCHKNRDIIVEYYEEETLKIDEDMKKKYEYYEKQKEDERVIYNKSERELKDIKSDLLGILKPIHNEFENICKKNYTFIDLDKIKNRFTSFYKVLS